MAGVGAEEMDAHMVIQICKRLQRRKKCRYSCGCQNHLSTRLRTENAVSPLIRPSRGRDFITQNVHLTQLDKQAAEKADFMQTKGASQHR